MSDVVVVAAGDEFVVQGLFGGPELGRYSIAGDALMRAGEELPAGGLLRLSSGVFPVDRPVELPSNVTLEGSGRASILSVTEANRDGIGVIAKDSDGVVIRSLSVRPAVRGGGEAGIVLDGCGSSQVSGVLSGGFGGYGMWVRNHSFLTSVDQVHAAANAKAGIYMDTLTDSSRTGHYVPTMVTGSLVYGGGEGILLNRAIVCNVSCCAVFQATGAAYHLRGSNSITLTGCRSFQIAGDAVVAEQSHELNFSGNILCWHTGTGMRIADCAWGAVAGNDIIDSSSWNSGKPEHHTTVSDLPADRDHRPGISLDSVRGFSLGANAIFNWEQGTRMHSGIIESESCYDNVISGTVVNYYEHDHVKAKGPGTIVRDTISRRDGAYAGPPHEPYFQSFQPEVTEEYLMTLLYS